MPRPKLRDRQDDFRGGLNLAADDETLAPNEVRRADDAALDEYGSVKKRLGTQRLADTALHSSGIQNGYAWLKDDGTQQLLAVANGTLYTASYAIGTTWTAQTGALKTSGAPAFVTFRNASNAEVVYIADGDTATSLNSWNGTAVSANITGTPAGITQLAVYNQRLFGCTGSDQKIWWSALNNGDTLGTATGGQAVIRTFGDQIITGLAAFRSSLLIFHQTGISRFTGLTQDDISIAAGAQGVTADVGAISGRSIVPTPDGVFFLSDRGFYVATEGNVQPISLKLDPLIRSLDFATASNVLGVHARARKEVWWFVPGKGVYRFNYALGAWVGPCQGGYLAPVTTAMWEAQDAEKQPIVLLGDADGYVKQGDVAGIYRDNVPTTGTGGTSYSMAVRCRRFVAGDSMQYKAFKWLYIVATLRASNAAAVTWLAQTGSGSYTIPNPGATASTWGTGTWGTGTWGSGATRPVRIPINGYGTYLDVLLTDGGDAESSWGIVELEGFDYGRRY
jgi:hypothetical protein